jgi:hypothetical protein
MILGEMPGRILWREDLLPDHGGNEVLLAEDLIHHPSQVVDFVVGNADENNTIVPH